jgi:hypothetical protein
MKLMFGGPRRSIFTATSPGPRFTVIRIFSTNQTKNVWHREKLIFRHLMLGFVCCLAHRGARGDAAHLPLPVQRLSIALALLRERPKSYLSPPVDWLAL